jgi:hypothetical protein
VKVIQLPKAKLKALKRVGEQTIRDPNGNLITYGGPWGTVPELLFEKKGLIPAVQQLLVSQCCEP